MFFRGISQKKFAIQGLLYIFLADFSVIYSFLNSMISDYGLAISEITFAFVIANISKMIADTWTGLISDKYGCRISLMMASCCRVILMILWLLYKTKQSFYCGMILWGTSGSLLSGKYETYSFNNFKKHHNEGYFGNFLGAFYSVSSLAISLSGLFGIYCFNQYGYNGILICNAIFFAMSGVVILFSPKEFERSVSSQKIKDIAKDCFVFLRTSSKDVRVLLGCAVIIDAIFFSFLDLNTVAGIDAKLKPSQIAQLVGTVSFIKIFMNLIAGSLSNFFSTKRVLMIMVVYSLLLALSSYGFLFVPIFFLISLFILQYSFLDIAIKNRVQNSIGKNYKSAVIASMGLASTIAMLLINITVTKVSSILSFKHSVFVIAIFLLFILSALLIIKIIPSKKKMRD